MEFKRPPKRKKSPEADAAKELIEYMESQGWYCKKMHGSIYQSGFPDYFCSHKIYGIKLIETKTDTGVLTSAQVKCFKRLHETRTNVYILKSVKDYKLIFGKANWMHHAIGL